MSDAQSKSKEPASNDAFGWLSAFVVGLLYFFASWTNAFGLGRWFYAPTILVCIVGLLAVAHILRDRDLLGALSISDVFFGGFLIWTAFACLANPNAKTLGYLFAYLFTFVGMAMLLKLVAIRFSSYRCFFYRANEYGVLVVSLFCFAEFVGRYSLGIDIQEWMPRGVAATAVYFNFPRVYGFSEEPTYLCWYLNTLGLLAIYTRWSHGDRRRGRYVITAVVVTAWIMTFSTAGFAFLLAGLGSAAIVVVSKDPRQLRDIWKSRRVWLRHCVVIGTLILVIGLSLTRDYRPLFSGVLHVAGIERKFSDIALIDMSSDAASGSSVFFGGMLEKITLTETHGISRIQQWREHFLLALQYPWLGLGPGYFSSKGESSSLNLFIFVGAEQGLPAMILLALGFFAIGLRVTRSRIKGSAMFLAGYLAGTAHLLTMTQHFHPALWLFVAAFYVEESTQTIGAAAAQLSSNSSALKVGAE
jgi:hypothetical protein